MTDEVPRPADTASQLASSRPNSRQILLHGRTIVYTLRRVRFEWAPTKAVANLRDHGISFAEAVTALEDTFALTREDPDATEERRFVTLGLSDEAKLLVVVYLYREPDIIRVLSAWRANRRQREAYEKGRG